MGRPVSRLRTSACAALPASACACSIVERASARAFAGSGEERRVRKKSAQIRSRRRADKMALSITAPQTRECLHDSPTRLTDANKRRSAARQRTKGKQEFVNLLALCETQVNAVQA